MTHPPDTPKSNKEDKDEKESPTGSSGSGNTDPTALTSYGSLPEFEVKGCCRLVEEVASKTYDGADADDDLDEDLLVAYNDDLLDQRKFFELSDEGKAYWPELPNQTSYHIQAVKAIDAAVKASNGDLHTEKKGRSSIEVGTTKKKYPDLAVWGKERLGEDGEPKVIDLDGGVPKQANPQVIIEFGWSSPLSNGNRDDQRSNEGASTGTRTCEHGHPGQGNSHLRN